MTSHITSFSLTQLLSSCVLISGLNLQHNLLKSDLLNDFSKRIPILYLMDVATAKPPTGSLNINVLSVILLVLFLMIRCDFWTRAWTV